MSFTSVYITIHAQAVMLYPSHNAGSKRHSGDSQHCMPTNYCRLPVLLPVTATVNAPKVNTEQYLPNNAVIKQPDIFENF